MRTLAFAAVTVVGACTPAAYAPPARLTPLDTPTAPAAGGTDLQGELGRAGTVFGPALADGSFRARHALSDGVVVEGETGMAAVTNSGSVVATSARSTTGSQPASTSRDAYTGRAGVILQGVDGAVRGALTAGVGGGYSAVAGGWTSVDIGAGFGSTHRWLRPWFNGDVSVNRAWSHRTFDIAYGDNEHATLELAPNAMVRGTAGLELGPVDRAFVVGLSVTRILANSDGVIGGTGPAQDDAFIGIAAGFRAQL